MTDPPHATIAIEGYDLLRELGRGAMGVVYLGRDRVLEREVAIKVIGEKSADDAIERFIREARAMARLAHPNVVTVYRAGVVDGEPYLVMELLRGRSLEAVLDGDGPLSAARLLEVALGATRGLAAAHARGIVHRDIKPSNLFETDDGSVKVLDFGIAKVLPASPVVAGDDSVVEAPKLANDTTPDVVAAPAGLSEEAMMAVTFVPGVDAMAATRQAEETPRVTSETRIGGTPLYMAPEVWRQEFADHASDVWSLGATLFTLATGQPPFVGRSIPEIAFKVLTNTASDPLASRRPDLPESLCAIVDRALSKARERRFASASEVLAALDRAVREAERPRALEGSPYPGLRPMASSDHDRFFGRDDDVARVVERLRGEALVVLVGPSGAGKSSLAAAGVAPAVARGALGEFAAWDVVRIAPGRTPLLTLAHAVAQLSGGDGEALAREMRDAPDALARALRTFVQQRGRGVLVLLDQLEEMVTLAERTDRDLVSSALGRMVSLAPTGVRVLATARSDLFDRLATLGTLGGHLGRATELVRPLAGDALRQAIEEPARAAGARFEDPSLIDSIVREVGTGEGALPLVAFAMRAWWERRDKATQTLTVRAWRDVGGVMGALGAYAESIFHALSVGDRNIARIMFQRLCAPDGTRRYSSRGELAATVGDAAGLARVLDALVRGRLLLSEGDTDDAQVTLAHEALSRAWPRMTHWQREGREDRALHERLRVAADVWTAATQSREMLWRGVLLAEVDRWRELYDDTLTPVERAFADASRREQRRGRWRARGIIAAALTAFAALGGFQWRAAGQARDAAVSQLRAVAERNAGRGAEDLAYAWREEDPATSLAYLARAARARGRASASMRRTALAYESRGVARQFECSAPPAVRGDGARVACPTGAAIRVMDVSAGTHRRIECVAGVRRVSIAGRADVVAWLDTAGTLWRQEGMAPPDRWATGLGARPVLALSASGRQAVVFERGLGKLTWIDRAGAGARTLASEVLPVTHDGRLGLVVTEHAVLLAASVSAVATELRRFDATERPLGDTRPVTTLAARARTFAIEDQRLAFVDLEGHIRSLDVDTGIESPCAPVARAVQSLAISRELPTRVAWLSRPAEAPSRVGFVTLDDPACAPSEMPAGPTDGVAFADRGMLALLSSRFALRLLDPVSRQVSGAIGPGLPSGAFEAPIAAVGRTFLLGGGPRGGAIWRGETPWTAPIGPPDTLVRDAYVTTAGDHAVLVDERDRVWIYARPSSAEVPVWRWHDVIDMAAVRRADARADVHVATPGHSVVAVVSAALGAFVLDGLDGRITWRAPQPLARAVDANGRFALLALEDGSGERIDIVSRVRISGALIDGTAPENVAITVDGTAGLVAGVHGPAVWRDLSHAGWPGIPMRAFRELEDVEALAAAGDRVLIAGTRIGVATRGAATLAEAPEAFYASAATSARFDDAGDAWLTDASCHAWRARCDRNDCAVTRVATSDLACALTPVNGGGWIAAGLTQTLALSDRSGAEAGIVALGARRDGTPPVAIAVDDDAITVAGPPADPWLRRIPLPPADATRFAAWVAARTNVVVRADGAREFTD